MQTTLKDLHRLETSIGQVVDQLQVCAAQRQSLTLSAYDSNVKETIEKQRKLVLEDVASARALVELRYTIRGIIQKANTEFGINALLNRGARLQAEIGLLSAAFSGGRGSSYRSMGNESLEDSLIDTILEKFRSVRQNQQSAIAREDSVGIATVLPQKEIDKHRAIAAALRRELEQVKDKVGTLNLTSTKDLVLTQDQQVLLRKHNIAYGTEG